MAGTAASNPLLNPAQPLAGKGLQQAAQSLTNAQVNGPLAELARQIAQNNQQNAAAQAKTAGYFNQLGKFTNQANQFVGGIGNQLNGTLQGIANDTGNGIARNAFVAAAAPGIQGLHATGLDGGALNNLKADYQQQAGTALNNAQAFRDFGATMGANYRGLANSNLGTYALKGQETLGNIARAGRLANEPINQKVADLKASRGSLLATNEGKLRQQEIQNAITAKGLGIKQSALAQQLQIANANRQSANDRAWLAHLDRVASLKLSSREQDAALKLKALGMSFGNIANVLKNRRAASGGGIDGSAAKGVQTVGGAINSTIGHAGLPGPFTPPKKK